MTVILIAVALVSALLGAGVIAGVAYTSRSVERSSHARATGLLEHLLEVERGRTADLLTRLAARNLNEYRAVAAPPPLEVEPARQYVTDATGLIAADADDDANVVG